MNMIDIWIEISFIFQNFIKKFQLVLCAESGPPDDSNDQLPSSH